MSAEEERVFWDAVDPSRDYKECIFEGPEKHGAQRILDVMGSSARGPWFDLGCGTGRLACLVASQVMRVDGYDISRSMLWSAQHVHPDNVWFHECDGRTIPAPADEYVGGWSVLLFQHLEPEAVKGYLAEVARVLRPGGRFVFQFAYDPEGTDAPYSQNHDPSAILDLCRTAGLVPLPDGDVVFVDVDELYPTWHWLTVEKR